MRTIRLNQESVRLIYSTDWHLTDVPPGSRSATYAEEIMAKIRFKGEYAKKVGGVCICGGDVFHQKSPRGGGNTFSLANRLIHLLRQYHHYGTHGNHDLQSDRTDSLPGQPLGNLIAAEVYDDISSSGSIIFENHDASVRVQVDAYPYADDMVTLERVLNAAPRDLGVVYRVVLMHQYGNPGGQGSLFGHPTIGYDQMADCDYDLALWGHDHSRAETVKVGRCTHVRLGSLSRASLAKDEVDRPVMLADIEFNGLTPDVIITEVPVPVRPLEIAFAAAHKEVERVNRSEEVVRFIQEMDESIGSMSDPSASVQESAVAATQLKGSLDPRALLEFHCPADEHDIFDLAVELCGV